MKARRFKFEESFPAAFGMALGDAYKEGYKAVGVAFPFSVLTELQRLAKYELPFEDSEIPVVRQLHHILDPDHRTLTITRGCFVRIGLLFGIDAYVQPEGIANPLLENNEFEIHLESK